MADMLSDGRVKVTYVPSIANIHAPTAAELAAASVVDLECFITSDGFEPTVDEDVVSVPKLCETFDAEAPGRAKYQIVLTMVRKDTEAEDIPWETLPRLTAGFLVVRYGIEHGTAYAASQEVQVFPGAFGEQRPQKVEANGAVKYQQQWYVSSQPDQHAEVAA